SSSCCSWRGLALARGGREAGRGGPSWPPMPRYRPPPGAEGRAMAWWARLAGWSALLAFPAWLLMPPYQRALASLAGLALEILGMRVQFEDVMVAAPFDLALFTAMCLATVRAPMRRRWRSLAIG